jgi:SAM-dependent methyltransferase
MPLRDLDLPLDLDPASIRLPVEVRGFLAEADRRIRRFDRTGRVTAFVPSNFPAAYAVLDYLQESGLARGTTFCEWGCGFGVVAGLAAGLGYAAHAIEIDGDLVAYARELCDDYYRDVTFVQGSFVPREHEERVAAAGEYSWMTTEADDAYDELGLDVADFDVVYAYPWPDEEAVTALLFEKTAGVGAVLVTYHGGDLFRARRKVAGKKKPRR